jgi:hypothetical protein
MFVVGTPISATRKMQGSMNAQTLFETEDLETTCRV